MHGTYVKTGIKSFVSAASYRRNQLLMRTHCC